MNTSEFMFNEMLKNPGNLDDMKLFLQLRDGFYEFYKKICVEFHRDVIVPGLNKEIAAYNSAHPGRNLLLRPLKKPDDCLAKNILTAASDYWPELYHLGFGKDRWDLAGWYIYLSAEEPAKIPQQIRDGLIKEQREKLSETKTLSNNEGILSFLYNEPLWSWDRLAIIPRLIADVVSRRADPEAECPLAAQYINDFMTLVRLVDQLCGKS
jgi:hypothetical protein